MVILNLILFQGRYRARTVLTEIFMHCRSNFILFAPEMVRNNKQDDTCDRELLLILAFVHKRSRITFVRCPIALFEDGFAVEGTSLQSQACEIAIKIQYRFLNLSVNSLKKFTSTFRCITSISSLDHPSYHILFENMNMNFIR